MTEKRVIFFLFVNRALEVYFGNDSKVYLIYLCVARGVMNDDGGRITQRDPVDIQ